MSFLVAITGKGGTGKTTVAASLVRQLLARGTRPVLAVDADPNYNLAELLGAKVARSLGAIREELLKKKAQVTGVSKARALELELAECLVEAEGFDLLTMGRPEGPSCYCYVNSLLRDALVALTKNYPVTVVDNEAGMEHLSRLNTARLDCLVVVAEPTPVSARAAARIAALTEELPVAVGRRVLVWNKVPRGGVGQAALAALDGARFAATLELPLDARVARLAERGEGVLAAQGWPEEFARLGEVCGVP